MKCTFHDVIRRTSLCENLSPNFPNTFILSSPYAYLLCLHSLGQCVNIVLHSHVGELVLCLRLNHTRALGSHHQHRLLDVNFTIKACNRSSILSKWMIVENDRSWIRKQLLMMTPNTSFNITHARPVTRMHIFAKNSTWSMHDSHNTRLKSSGLGHIDHFHKNSNLASFLVQTSLYLVSLSCWGSCLSQWRSQSCQCQHWKNKTRSHLSNIFLLYEEK